MKTAVNLLSSILLCITIVILIVTASIGLPIYFRPFYYCQIDALHLPDYTDHTKKEIKEAYDDLLDYLTLPSQDFKTGVLKHSAEGKSHFDDCKTLFTLNLAAILISTVVVIALGVLHKKKIITLKSGFGFGLPAVAGATALTVSLLLLLTVLFDFDSAFTLFHRILFSGKDNWYFAPDRDEIIRILPKRYFLNCGILIGVSVLAVSATLILIGIIKKIKCKT